METFVRCNKAAEGDCKITWCVHYLEHGVYLKTDFDELSGPCTRSGTCETIGKEVYCRLCTEN